MEPGSARALWWWRVWASSLVLVNWGAPNIPRYVRHLERVRPHRARLHKHERAAFDRYYCHPLEGLRAILRRA